MQTFIKGVLFALVPIFGFSTNAPRANQVDAVIFSYNRPLQLYALLESMETYLSGINEMHVIYRTDDDRYEKAYQTVAHRFSQVRFHAQGLNPAQDFKPLVLECVYSKSSPCPYFMFLVDDIIVTDYVDVTKCTQALEKYHAWGFFLRLGKNIQYVFSRELKPTPCPKGVDLENHYFCWQFKDGSGDWGYPNNVDMTIYRKEEQWHFLETEIYSNPTLLEFVWWHRWANLERYGISFQASKNINLPLNLVSTFRNRFVKGYSTQRLLKKFEEGYKLNISAFSQIEHSSVHVDFKPSFIQR